MKHRMYFSFDYEDEKSDDLAGAFSITPDEIASFMVKVGELKGNRIERVIKTLEKEENPGAIVITLAVMEVLDMESHGEVGRRAHKAADEFTSSTASTLGALLTTALLSGAIAGKNPADILKDLNDAMGNKENEK